MLFWKAISPVSGTYPLQNWVTLLQVPAETVLSRYVVETCITERTFMCTTMLKIWSLKNSLPSCVTTLNGHGGDVYSGRYHPNEVNQPIVV